MIQIARPIEGVSINGMEWLLDENGETMKFENKEIATNFLRSKGFQDFSAEDFEDAFLFEEVDDKMISK